MNAVVASREKRRLHCQPTARGCELTRTQNYRASFVVFSIALIAAVIMVWCFNAIAVAASVATAVVAATAASAAAAAVFVAIAAAAAVFVAAAAAATAAAAVIDAEAVITDYIGRCLAEVPLRMNKGINPSSSSFYDLWLVMVQCCYLFAVLVVLVVAAVDVIGAYLIIFVSCCVVLCVVAIMPLWSSSSLLLWWLSSFVIVFAVVVIVVAAVDIYCSVSPVPLPPFSLQPRSSGNVF